MTDLVTASPPSPGFGRALGAYLLDGFRVRVLPVSVIANAANRELPVGICIALLLAIDLIGLVLDLPGYFQLASTGAISTGQMLINLGQDFAWRVSMLAIALAVVFGMIKLLGGKGSLSRFLSAALVVHAFLIVWSLVATAASLGAFYLMGDEPPGGFALSLAMIGLYLPVVVAVIALAYFVLVARFGGLLDYWRAFAVLAILVALAVGLLMLQPEPMLGPFGPTGGELDG